MASEDPPLLDQDFSTSNNMFMKRQAKGLDIESPDVKAALSDPSHMYRTGQSSLSLGNKRKYSGKNS